MCKIYFKNFNFLPIHRYRMFAVQRFAISIREEQNWVLEWVHSESRIRLRVKSSFRISLIMPSHHYEWCGNIKYVPFMQPQIKLCYSTSPKIIWYFFNNTYIITLCDNAVVWSRLHRYVIYILTCVALKSSLGYRASIKLSSIFILK